ncbi:MAG: hypothetical protein HC880_19555 [Bacteroidia bacterium]|nr:hypothetical protein [Bacteroidia bacterium]
MAQWLGTPYIYAGNDRSGTDCSGFTQQLYREVYGIATARTAYDMCDETQKVALNDLREGDMIFFKIKSTQVSHVGVYLHNGYFVHAVPSQGVVISQIQEPYYQKYFFQGGRMPLHQGD